MKNWRSVLLLAALLGTHAGAQTPGTEDVSYGGSAPQGQVFSDIAALPDGKVLAAGGNRTDMSGRLVVWPQR
jgi:hypothetical protein